MKTVFKLCIALVLMGAIVWKVGVSSILTSLSKADPRYIVLAYGVLVLVILLNALNVRRLLRPFAYIPLTKIFRPYAKSWAWGFLTPAKLGEFSLVRMLPQVKSDSVSAAILMDKVMTIVALTVLSVGVATPTQMIIVAIIPIVCVYFIVRGVTLPASFGRLGVFVNGVFGSVHVYRSNPGILVGSFLNAILRWGFFGIQSVILFASIGVVVNPLVMISIVSISTIVSLIPITIGGLGLREGSFILFATQAGIASDAAATVAILSLIVGYVSVAVIGVITGINGVPHQLDSGSRGKNQ